MEPGLGKLCELRDIASELQRNVRISWGLILAPNILCIIGVFTLGFGIAASVLTNNVAALGALLNGVRAMRRVAAYEAERRHLLELQLRQSGFLDASRRRPRRPGDGAVEAIFDGAATDTRTVRGAGAQRLRPASVQDRRVVIFRNRGT